MATETLTIRFGAQTLQLNLQGAAVLQMVGPLLGLADEIDALAAITADITIAAANIEDIQAAPGSAMDAAASATAADASADAASASATTAVTSETNAAASETAAAGSASAAATSETNAAASETAAAGSASAAATSESNAAASETAAAGSASAAAASETNADDSEAAAAASASAAATSETNAAGSATDAAASLADAQAIETALEAIAASGNMFVSNADMVAAEPFDTGAFALVLVDEENENHATVYQEQSGDMVEVLDLSEGVPPDWGDIGGTLADQTDLQAALDLKADDAAVTAALADKADLDGSGKVPVAQLPGIAITSRFVVSSQTAQLALTAEEGDVAIRTDLSKSYIQNGGTAGTMADWSELLTPTDAVTSVAGKTGVVTLVKGDVGLGNVDNTSDANKPVSTAQQAALDAKRGFSKRVVAAGATSGTLTPNADTTDTFKATGLTGTVTFANPTGTPTDQQQLILYYEDNGTSRTINRGTQYRAEQNVTLPTATTAGKHVREGYMYNQDDAKWDCVAVVREA